VGIVILPGALTYTSPSGFGYRSMVGGNYKNLLPAAINTAGIYSHRPKEAHNFNWKN